jgi:Beta-ketoacyl synthase, N-terminal domain
MSTAAFIEAVGFAAPGMPDWSSARAVLRDEQPYLASDLPVYQPTLLPPNERRRASPTVRMAFRVAEAATQHSSIAAAELACVFCSADGDLAIANRICSALAEPQRFISPTDFHNSVHNAAAGYWSIASLATGPATALAAFDDSFAVGLIEAMSMVLIEQQPTLLVVYDVPGPAPLLAKRPVQDPVGVSMVLTSQPTANSLAKMIISMQSPVTAASITTLLNTPLEALRLGNPAARALPLLQLLATQSGQVILALPNHNQLLIQLSHLHGKPTRDAHRVAA